MSIDTYTITFTRFNLSSARSPELACLNSPKVAFVAHPNIGGYGRSPPVSPSMDIVQGDDAHT